MATTRTRTDTPASIRVGTPADAARLAAFGRKTFSETFGPDNTAEDLRLHLDRTFSPDKQAAELADPEWTTLLQECDGELAGYAQVRMHDSPASVTTPAPIELLRFYVDAKWHGQGLAAQLMKAVFEAAATHGARSVWLCVWQENPRAIAFYGKQGFITVGSQVFILGTDRQLDWVMARPL